MRIYNIFPLLAGHFTIEDQVFVSGDYHDLHDTDEDKSLDLGASLTLTWDLRDLAYESNQIDLSRESRLVIGLRDDVLDEVNQLYFERLTILSDLSAADTVAETVSGLGSESPEDFESAARRISRLEMRLYELTAGLDAWTGGWFSQQLESSAIEGM